MEYGWHSLGFCKAINALDMLLDHPPPNLAKSCKGLAGCLFMSLHALDAICWTNCGLKCPQAHCSTKKSASSLCDAASSFIGSKASRVLWPSLLFLEGWEESASVMFGWQSVETKHTSGQTYVLICFDQIIGALGYGALVVSNTKWKQIWEHLGASVWLYVLK